MIILQRKCDIMAIKAISTVEPRKKPAPSMGLTALAGAAIGEGLRYVLPNNTSKNIGDTFISQAKKNASERSILKYGALGALVAVGANLLYRAFNNENKEEKKKKDDNVVIEYSKIGALIDAPDYACEIMWYSD